jgi:predicted RNase H-like nuclease (RuvC/YqgF family)
MDYRQLKTTNEELQTHMNELEVDLEQVTTERDDMSSKLERATTTNDCEVQHAHTPTHPVSSIFETSPIEKPEKELQHLDSVVVVWDSTLKKATAKRDQTQE